MSFNQSRPDKNDSLYRKYGRSASSHQYRSSPSSSAPFGGKGAGAAPAPSPSSLSSNRSFKKSNNAQGGGGHQSRPNLPPAFNSSSSDSTTNPHTPRTTIQNGARVQPVLYGGAGGGGGGGLASDAPPSATNAPKQTEAPPTQRSTRAVPKAPTSQSASMTSVNATPTTPAKPPGDASKAFAFQFGSISPGFMNGMQIPARTSSAPPNLDEQKRDQARHDAFRSVPPLPTPAPMQQLPRKDVSTVDQSNGGESHPAPKAKKETQPSPAAPASQAPKPAVLPTPITSMPIAYHQPQGSVPFGGPNPQIQSQSVTATSLQMAVPMPLPMGNAPQLQQQMFVQGLQHHPMQHQGILHHGQSLSFTPTMAPQLPPQLGNLGMGITSQYPQQQGGKFGPRKTTVKITDPKTHEELRLDKRADSYADGGSSGLRVHPTAPPQSQLIPSFATSSPINYFSTSYNASNPFLPPNSQQIRCNYPVNQAPQNVSHMNSSALNPHSVNKSGVAIHTVAEPPNSDHIRDAHSVVSSASSGTVHVTVKPPASSAGNKIMESSMPNSSSTSEKSGSHKLPKPSGDSGSFPPQKDSESIPDSPFQQPKPGSDSSSSKSLLMPSKQSEATGVDSMISNSSVPALLSQPGESLLFATEGKRRESLSRSNSTKDHHKKSGKKGCTQPQHQILIGGQSTMLSSSSSHPPEHGISSDGTIESVETKTAPLLSSTASECFTESIRETESEILASTNVNSETKVSVVSDSALNVSSESTSAGVIVDSLDTVDHCKLDDQSLQEQLKCETVGTEKHGEKGLTEDSKEEDNSFEVSSASISSQSVALVKEAKESALAANQVATSETAKQQLDEPGSSLPENDDGRLHGDLSLTLDASSNQCESACDKEVSVVPDWQFAPLQSPDNLEATSKCEGEGIANIGGSSASLAVSGSKDKSAELTRSKSSTSKVRKKRKEALQKADAAGTTSDLYMAYKGPEERKESSVASEITESTSNSCNMKQALSNSLQAVSGSSEKHTQNKAEPDDWEDAADISSPKLETPKKEQAHGGLMQADKNGSTVMTKKYSRDFLLKFSEQCRSLPEGFEVTSDISEALMSVNVSHLVDRDIFHSPGRVIDRINSRTDRRGSNMGDEERWSNKQAGAFGSRDSRMETTPVPNSGFRVGNSGVLKIPRGPPFVGGILTGPMPSFPSQGMQRNSPDADRWQRGTNFQQKGLIPSPQSQTPLQMMHKAEKKYEVGKVADQEELKQRQLKAILNKLTPQNFEKLFEQVKAVNIDNAVTLTGVISQIFDKALMEPTFCEMYANFCYHLAGELPDFNEDNEKITFKRLLLNKCQEEFERGEREQEEANKADEEGEIKQSGEGREDKRLKARRRMLGNIRLIGELYKKKMLTERIMHECIKKLLGQYQNPDEEDIEALCKLLSTIGEMIDHPKAKEHMDAYFDWMAKLSNNMKLSSRVRFMLKDAIDLRKNKWQQRRKVEGPKKIEEVHRDAAQERQLQGSRLARNPSMSSARRAPMDFGPRGSSMLSSPSGAQMGGYRGLPAQARGYGTQDVRFEDRQSCDARTLSVALPQRPLGDEPITLGPQGGLARGMSIRGPPVVANSATSDVSHSSIDSRRVGAGMNGFGAASDRPTYSPKEEVHPRHPDRFAVPTAYDQDRHMNYINRDPRNLDRGFDRSLTTSPPTQAHGPALNQNAPLEKVWSEERLRDMSMSAIREFYSARDEKEVALCITDLNSPSFHPSMIALWVVDSFERKDMERDLLAKLLVNLTRSQDGILSSAQLVKGFESVLTTLEDAVNDAPKAAEFLGRIFAKVVVENVVPLQKIGSLLYEGGEEPRRLLEIGLAGDVLGSTLEMIKSEKGEGALKEIRSGSNLRLEDFQPPDANRSRILEKFI